MDRIILNCKLCGADKVREQQTATQDFTYYKITCKTCEASVEALTKETAYAWWNWGLMKW